MRKISRYQTAAIVVHDDCVAGVTDGATRTRLASMHHTVAPTATEYDLFAQEGRLFEIPAKKTRLDDAVVFAATRRDLKDLYDRHMVARGKPGRLHYDPILLSAPQQKCPYCGFGQATTLDHYLPKCRYPQFSVTPSNLVPSCRDCQSKKGRHVAVSGSAQTLHPYFDRECFFQERWIFGEVVPGPPLTVKYKVDAPADWSDEDRTRVESHFAAHGLGLRFAIESATELAMLRELYIPARVAGNYDEIRVLLQRQASAYESIGLNSWQSTLYHALASDRWYCSATEV